MRRFDEETFKGRKFSSEELRHVDFEYCTFINCDFSDQFATSAKFVECTFEQCNLSNMSLSHAVLSEVSFLDSKLIGVKFSECNPLFLSLSFTASNLDLCVFNKLKLANTYFQNCHIHQASFIDCDLKESDFSQTELDGTLFENCDLSKTNLRTATGFTIDPEMNKLKGAKFKSTSLVGLLTKYDLDIN